MVVLAVKTLDQHQCIKFEKANDLEMMLHSILQERELFVGKNDLITAHLKQTEI